MWVIYMILGQKFSYGDACSEIFFFNLILSADGMKEIYDVKEHKKLRVLLFSTVLFVIIILATIYGILLLNANLENMILQLDVIYRVSKVLTVFCVVVNLCIQLIGGAESNE